MNSSGALSIGLVLLISAGGLASQQRHAWAGGAARFAVSGQERAGPVTVYQGKRVSGFGELVRLGDGAVSLFEFRGYVPKGPFRISKASKAVRASKPRVQLSMPGRSARVSRCEGELVHRFRLRSEGRDLRVDGDAFLWPDGEHELVLSIEAKSGFDGETETLLPLRWPGKALRVVESSTPGLRLGAAPPGLVIPAGSLRPGDLVFCSLSSGLRSPAGRVPPSPALLEQLRVGGQPARRRASRSVQALAKRLLQERDQLMVRLAADPRTKEPVNLGDAIRREDAEGLAVWTHGEFDAPLGLLFAAAGTRRQDLFRAAKQGLWHMLGRDVSRSFGKKAHVLRLPVRHGAVHGRGAVDAGHVFLESGFALGLSTADRLLLEKVSARLDALDVLLAGMRSASLLRELAWPLRNFLAGLAYRRHAAWTKRVTQVLSELLEHEDTERGFFDFPEERGPRGRVLELWLLSGLLLPALKHAASLGMRDAGRLRRRLLRSIQALPRSQSGFATHYLLPEGGEGWRAEGGAQNACCAAWVIEGLRGQTFAAARVRTLKRRILNALPGDAWDAPTAFALLLRLRFVAAGYRTSRGPDLRASPRR